MIKKIFILGLVSIFLSCSGGSKSDTDTNNSLTDNETTQQQLDNTSTISISVQNIKQNDNLSISIISLDNSANLIDKKTINRVSKSTSIVIIEQVKISQTGGKINIVVSSPGYTNAFKTISYSKPSDAKTLNVFITMTSL